mmetsp:Transcript_8922/g.23011  ORF Transcript_8922/g.23011 Transcript_8922/m.23011 type:complete len:397 (-) Transcript_8922:1454-2644(-)
MPSVAWLLQNRARAVLLAAMLINMCAGGPLLPGGEDAVVHFLAGGLAVLGVDHDAVACRTALVVHGGDGAVPLAEALALQLRPITPGRELTIHGHAIRAGLADGAEALVDLRAGALGVLAANEEVAPRRSLLVEAQEAAAHARCVAAGGVAGRPRPLRPRAEELVLAVALAIRDLLGDGQVARLALGIRHPLDGAPPVPLASASRAVAPPGPGAPDAVLRLGVLARLQATRLGDLEVAQAGQPVVGSRLDNAALAGRLASAAGHGAPRPDAPLTHDAVHLRVVHAAYRRRAIVPGVARLYHLQRVAIARLARAGREDGDDAVALADARAGAAALRPLVPRGQLAVAVWNARRHVAAAHELLLQARGRCAAVVGVAVDLAASRLVRNVAAAGAFRPR